MKKLLNVLKYVVFLGLGFGIFFYVYPLDELNTMREKLGQANYVYLIPVIVVALVSHYSRALRWKMLIDPLGYHTKPFNAFRAVMIGYYFNTLVPRMGEVSRCVALNRIDKIPVSVGLGTVITERIFDLILLAGVVGLTVILDFDLVGNMIIDMVNQKVDSMGGLWSPKGAILLVGLMLGIFVAHRIFKKLGVYDKVIKLLLEFKNGVLSIGKLKHPMAFIGHTAFIWICYYAMCYMSFFTYDETGALGLRAGLVVFTLSTIGFIAPVPGGIGTYQYMFTLALALYAIEEETAKAVAMIAFLVNTVLNLIIGAIALIFSPKQNPDASVPQS